MIRWIERNGEKERFLKKVHKTGSCWIWKGASTKFGHGRGTFNKRVTTAHRISYMIFNGEIPPGMNVCHKCDNPPCVNPDHLFIGNQSDNMIDAVKKGRVPCGSKNYISKLNESLVKEIRLRFENGETNKSLLGRNYNVDRKTIDALLEKRTWKHV